MEIPSRSMSSKSLNIDFVSFQNIWMGVIPKNRNVELLVNNIIIITKHDIAAQMSMWEMLSLMDCRPT